jgi:hypothetical protein
METSAHLFVPQSRLRPDMFEGGVIGSANWSEPITAFNGNKMVEMVLGFNEPVTKQWIEDWARKHGGCVSRVPALHETIIRLAATVTGGRWSSVCEEEVARDTIDPELLKAAEEAAKEIDLASALLTTTETLEPLRQVSGPSEPGPPSSPTLLHRQDSRRNQSRMPSSPVPLLRQTTAEGPTFPAIVVMEHKDDERQGDPMMTAEPAQAPLEPAAKPSPPRRRGRKPKIRSDELAEAVIPKVARPHDLNWEPRSYGALAWLPAARAAEPWPANKIARVAWTAPLDDGMSSAVILFAQAVAKKDHRYVIKLIEEHGGTIIRQQLQPDDVDRIFLARVGQWVSPSRPFMYPTWEAWFNSPTVEKKSYDNRDEKKQQQKKRKDPPPVADKPSQPQEEQHQQQSPVKKPRESESPKFAQSEEVKKEVEKAVLAHSGEVKKEVEKAVLAHSEELNKEVEKTVLAHSEELKKIVAQALDRQDRLESTFSAGLLALQKAITDGNNALELRLLEKSKPTPQPVSAAPPSWPMYPPHPASWWYPPPPQHPQYSNVSVHPSANGSSASA